MAWPFMISQNWQWWISRNIFCSKCGTNFSVTAQEIKLFYRIRTQKSLISRKNVVQNCNKFSIIRRSERAYNNSHVNLKGRNFCSDLENFIGSSLVFLLPRSPKQHITKLNNEMKLCVGLLPFWLHYKLLIHPQAQYRWEKAIKRRA